MTRSRCGRSMRGCKGKPGWSPLLTKPPPMKGVNDTRAGPLLLERARSECARSTAAVEPTQVPFHKRKSTLTWEARRAEQAAVLKEVVVLVARTTQRFVASIAASQFVTNLGHMCSYPNGSDGLLGRIELLQGRKRSSGPAT